jgi:hypothetical protein
MEFEEALIHSKSVGLWKLHQPATNRAQFGAIADTRPFKIEPLRGKGPFVNLDFIASVVSNVECADIQHIAFDPGLGKWLTAERISRDHFPKHVLFSRRVVKTRPLFHRKK